jgi:IclR family pca regulon transcriptional regulator
VSIKPIKELAAVKRQARSSLFVGSTEKAFQVLEAFNGPNRHMSMAEIARAAELDRSATQRLVYTLEKLGYLRRMPESMLYGLTSKVLRLSYNYLRANELIDKASPYLLDISRILGETTNLQELDGHEIVFLARFPGRHLVNVDFAVGSRLPAVFTASGTAILSRFADAQRREFLQLTPLKSITPYTELDPGRLLARIQVAAEKGYSIVMN